MYGKPLALLSSRNIGRAPGWYIQKHPNIARRQVIRTNGGWSGAISLQFLPARGKLS